MQGTSFLNIYNIYMLCSDCSEIMERREETATTCFLPDWDASQNVFTVAEAKQILDATGVGTGGVIRDMEESEKMRIRICSVKGEGKK